MSLHYLIDGYNLVKSTEKFNALPLADGRDALLRWLLIARPQGSGNNEVTVVFDGKSDVFGGSYQNQGIRVIFTQDTSADDLIREMVEAHANPKSLVVVSDDKDIVIYSRALGAKVVGVKTFTQSVIQVNKSRSKPVRAQESSKYISHTKADAINKELRKLWVDDD